MLSPEDLTAIAVQLSVALALTLAIGVVLGVLAAPHLTHWAHRRFASPGRASVERVHAIVRASRNRTIHGEASSRSRP